MNNIVFCHLWIVPIILTSILRATAHKGHIFSFPWMSFIYRFDSISNSINLFDFGCSIDYVSGMVEIPSNDLILSHLVSFLHTRTWISIQFPFVKFCFWRIVRVVLYCELFLFNILCSRSVLFLSIYLRNKISLTFLKPAFTIDICARRVLIIFKMNPFGHSTNKILTQILKIPKG